MIPPEAVEAAARALYVSEYGPWVSGSGITPGGTPWGTSRESLEHDTYLTRARHALEAAAPYMLAAAKADAWDEATKALVAAFASGERRLINPYRTPNAR